MGYATHGWLILAAGCTLADSPPAPTATDDTADTATVDTAASDTGTAPPTGQRLRVGTATVDATSYVGVENVRFVAEDGDGETLCDVSYTLQSVAVRTDCGALCEWAFDIVIADAAVVVDTGAYCATIIGVDAGTVDTLNGQALIYGYTSEYVGHAAVLMSIIDDEWKALDYASYDPATGVLEYELDDGLYPY